MEGQNREALIDQHLKGLLSGQSDDDFLIISFGELYVQFVKDLSADHPSLYGEVVSNYYLEDLLSDIQVSKIKQLGFDDPTPGVEETGASDPNFSRTFNVSSSVLLGDVVRITSSVFDDIFSIDRDLDLEYRLEVTSEPSIKADPSAGLPKEATKIMPEPDSDIGTNSELGSNTEHLSRLIATFRERLIDLSRSNRLINYRHSESSNTHIRIINCGLNDLVGAIDSGRSLEFDALTYSDSDSDDEDTPEFKAEFEAAILSDPEYLENVHSQNLEGSDDPEAQSQFERALKNRIRTKLGLRPLHDSLPASPAVIARALGIDPSYELELDSDDISQGRFGQIQTLFLPPRMEAKLGKIRDSARRSIEESGINRLYLAIGFLEWREADHSDRPNYAPLLVIPVKIERQSSANRWRYFLSKTDEPMTDNIALRIRMGNENIDLPVFDDVRSIEEYFDKTRNAIKEKEGWKVHNYATVGLFSFANIEIWADLDEERWADNPLSENQNVGAIFGGGEFSSDLFAEEFQIDSPEITSQIPPLILNADSSQLSTIIDALSERNLAVKGPPGTGKSQTIANLIGAALFKGKKVLFLAEKMAALEVVKSRLDDVGLGEFALELHSSKGNTRNVIAGLNDRLENRPSDPSNGDIETKIDHLESLKQQLNEYVEVINSPAAKTGKTIHDVLWASQNRRHIFSDPAFRGLNIAGAEKMNLVSRERCETALDVFENSARDIEKNYGSLEGHPWSWIEQPVDTFSRDELVDSVSKYLVQLEELDEITQRLSTLGIGADLDSPAQLAHLSNFIERIPPAHGDSLPQLLPLLSDPNARQSIDSLIQLTISRGNYQDDLTPIINIEAPINDLEKLVEHVRNKPNFIDSSISIQEVSDAKVLIASRIALIQNAQVQEKEISEAFGASGNLSGKDIELLIEASALVFEAEDNVLELISEHLSGPRALADLETALSQAQELIERKEDLSQRFQIDAIGLPEHLREEALIIKTTGLVGRLLPTYRKAKRSWVSIARSDNSDNRSRSKDPEGMAQDLEELASFKAGEHRFNSDERLTELVTSGFRGLDTDFETWHKTAKFMNEARELAQSNDVLGPIVWSVLNHGLGDRLARIKRLIASGGTSHLREVGSTDDFGPNETLDDKLSESLVIHRWCSDLEELGASVDLVEDTRLSNVEEILVFISDYRRICSQIDESTDALNILKGCGIEPEESMQQIAKTLQYAGLLTAEFPDDANWTASLFAENVTEMISELSIIRSQLTEWSSKAKVLRTPLEEVSTAEFAAQFFRPEDRSFRVLRDRFKLCTSDPQAIGSWNRYLETSNVCSELKLNKFSGLFDSTRPFSLAEGYQGVYWHSLARRAFKQNPVLTQFSGESQEAARTRFKELDQEIMKLNRILIASRLRRNPRPSGIRNGPRGNWTEMSLINVLLPQQKPRVKIRDLVRRAGRSLQALQPCFMMSPSSVAQFLEPGAIDFDIVIIDEASQMRPEESIGAIARSRQSVVVGDPMQLPPTSFFNRVDTLVEDLEEDLEDDSILDMALASFTPYRDLRWHYRSRHHDLIRFSNKHFYDDRLIVFPSPANTDETDQGVRYHKADATYMGAGGNPHEAQMVAAAAIRALKERPDWSLGVVAVNREQTDLIRTEFDQLLLRDGAARAAWNSWEGTLYPGFIKNLENVQGDERDRIIISTVYGPNEEGRVLQRFGPIINKNGHRRLNVLYTRAKQRVDLFSSMTASDVRVENQSSLGARALHGYLDYAATLRLDSGTPTGRDPDSEFEIFVADALRTAGYEAVPQIGAGGYFIDLGVRHPSYPHGFLAGIECDGATYHSAKSAKDRDALRQGVLEDMGWTIYRVWSTDWFNDPGNETRKLVAFLDQLRSQQIRATEPTEELPWEADQDQTEEDSGQDHSAESQELLDDWDDEDNLSDEFHGVTHEEPIDTRNLADASNIQLPLTSESPVSETDQVPPRAAEESESVPSTDSSISVDRARQQLIRLREGSLQRNFRDSPRDQGLLRRSMLEALLNSRPTTKEQFQMDIPQSLRLNTDPQQIEGFLEYVLAIIKQIGPH